jgi:perosamine synthetase
MSPPRTQTRRIKGFDLRYSKGEVETIASGLLQILEDGFISMGRNVAEFERLWAEFCGVKYAIGTTNGTCSLEIILRALEIKGHTVVVPSHTFIATAVAAIHAGARVIFVDCQRENLQMDPADLRRKIRADTKAVVLVHMSGIISPHLSEIRAICEEHEVVLLEDAAHAHGATINGHKAGALGRAGSFSFFSTKVLTTGEGGMIVTDDELIQKRALALRDHGRFTARPNLHDDIGYNWRPSELHAVLGIAQVRRAEIILERRRAIAHRYDEQLRARNIPGIKLLHIPDYVRSAYYKYVVFLNPPLERGALKRKLKEEYGVTLGSELYDRPCHSQPLFQRYPETVVPSPPDSFPETDYVVAHHICLPLYFDLTDGEADAVVNALEAAVRSLLNR